MGVAVQLVVRDRVVVVPVGVVVRCELRAEGADAVGVLVGVGPVNRRVDFMADLHPPILDYPRRERRQT